MNSFRRCRSLTLLFGAAIFAFAARGWSQDSPHEKTKVLFEKTGELTEQDDFDKLRKKSYHKVHEFAMEKGKVYRIDIKSKDFDTLLRVENPDGVMVGVDDDGGDNSNSRLAFKAPTSGDYRLIVTSFPPAETGKYTISVSEPTKLDLLTVDIRSFKDLTNDERTKAMERLLAHYDSVGKKISAPEANLAMTAGFAMEGAKMKGTGDWYTKLGRALEQAENPRIQRLSKMMEGSARRVRLPGNPIDIKGETLDGKAIDWASYRGKVVLVDFWATWCGPCIAELPNVKRMYETYKDKGFDVVGISLDRDAEKPADFMKRRGLPWACIYEEKQPLAEHYGVMGIPLAILVGKDGKVISLEARGPELGRLLERELGEK